MVGCWEVSRDHSIPLTTFAVSGWVERAVTHPGLGVSVSRGVGRTDAEEVQMALIWGQLQDLLGPRQVPRASEG